MNRRTGWVVGAAIAAALLLGVAVWFWQGSSAPPATSPPPTPVATTAAPLAVRAQAALDEHLTACAASTNAAPPEHCGIRIPWGTEFSTVTGIRYRVEKLPVLQLDGDTFTAGGGTLVATVTGIGQDGAPRIESYRTEDWAVRGDVTVTDDEVAVDVW